MTKTTAEDTAVQQSDQVWQIAILQRAYANIKQLPDPHRHPRTRAFAKQENESRGKGTAEQPVTAPRRFSSRQRGLQPEALSAALRQDHLQAFVFTRNKMPLIKETLSAKRTAKQSINPVAKREVKRKQVLSSRREAQTKEAPPSGDTVQVQVSTTCVLIRSRYIL